MKAACSAQLGPKCGPVYPMLPADVGQRGLDPLFEATQAAYINVSLFPAEKCGNLTRASAQAILNVLPLAALAGIDQLAMQLGLRNALKRAEVRKFVRRSGAIEE